MSQGVNEKLQRWGFDTEIDPLNEQNRVPSFLALEALETLERSMKSYSLPFRHFAAFFQRRRRGMLFVVAVIPLVHVHLVNFSG